MPRPLKRGILGASTIILSKNIDKYAFMCGSNFLWIRRYHKIFWDDNSFEFLFQCSTFLTIFNAQITADERCKLWRVGVKGLLYVSSCLSTIWVHVMKYSKALLKIQHQLWTAKGQLISECLFDFLNFPKNQQKIWQISAQGSKKWSNHKIKAYYDDFI